MYKTPAELRAEQATEHPSVPLSQGDILDACPLVFWADQTTEVTEDDKPQSVRARVIILTQPCDLANERPHGPSLRWSRMRPTSSKPAASRRSSSATMFEGDKSTGGISSPPMRHARSFPSPWST